MTDDIFIKIERGFTDIYGIEWSDAQVDLYNKVSLEIKQREQEGFPVSEQMLSNRHRIYHVPIYNRNATKVDDEENRRRFVHVDFENGQSVETAINGPKESVRNYYLNNQFNVGGLTHGKSVIFLS